MSIVASITKARANFLNAWMVELGSCQDMVLQIRKGLAFNLLFLPTQFHI